MAQITQSDIARKLQVSRITVSKALRDHSDISVEMKKKVHDVAAELGYIPNLIAKNLIERKTYTMGVVIPDLENSFFSFATDSIIDAANEEKYSVFVTVSRETQENEMLNIQKLIGMRVDGLLVCVSQQTKDPRIFHSIQNMEIPLVFFDRKFEGLNFSSVTFDDTNGAVTALNEIIQSGYTKIAHFAGYSNVSIGRARCLGYQLALEKNDIKVNPEWIIEGGFEVKDGYEAFLKLADTGNLPEIIFTVNDRVALGVYQAAKEAGLHIPEDIGVIAYGFCETARTFTPELSIINQNPRRIGRTAVEMLIGEIGNKEAGDKNHIIIEEEFLWHQSIKKKKQ